MAAARAFGTGINSLDLDFIREYGWLIAPGATGRLRTGHPRPHDTQDWNRNEFSIFADAWVDRTEINAMLEHLRSKPSLVSKERVRWPLGELPEGHEFVAVFKNLGKKEEERRLPPKCNFDPSVRDLSRDGEVVVMNLENLEVEDALLADMSP